MFDNLPTFVLFINFTIFGYFSPDVAVPGFLNLYNSYTMKT